MSGTEAGRLPALLHGDFHVHSTFSDDARSTLAENIAAASAVGLRTIRLTDHVRASTTWVPEFLTAVAAERVPDGLTVLTGVEAKLLDASGAVDTPPGLVVGPGGVDAVVIGDHQFPGTDGPWSPTATRERLDAGLSVDDALDLFVEGSIRAMERTPHAQLAHWFSILPKVGLDETQLGAERLAAWAQAAAATGTIVEVNEKWNCPGPDAIAALLDAGARIVASTDSHVAADVGRYDRVRQLLDAAASRVAGERVTVGTETGEREDAR
ncbi:PHP domain-containing protein [Leifsonia sp. 1010]|uniref:PHP domain-containing protein n=1 Tax=Leifsonia sp. 1010 TaxID=2817769 RepID=UPI0028646CD2|nr:PHP domain-containing protein [Leifsonia sp. 1010]MDR6612788.1 putative hydrolase [Leifsonia sp. 1010]